MSCIKWLNDACLVARASGQGHDVGKACSDFQKKLIAATLKAEPSYTKDPARHEIVSAVILAKMLDGKTWEQAWESFQLRSTPKAIPFIGQGISNYQQAILFCIATHHKLFAGEQGNLNLKSHLSIDSKILDVSVKIESERSSSHVKAIAERLVSKITAKQDKESNLYWQGIALVARAALILADHKISGQQSFKPDTGQCFANTRKKINKKKSKPGLHQSLDWHLSHVGQQAGIIMEKMALLDAPQLSVETKNILAQPANEFFDWQNKAAALLIQEKPSLVFNVAATGSGKTRMNARAATLLAGDKPLRLTVSLNLRSLTLQTGDVYQNELGIQANELAVVIGDSAVRKMHDYEADDINQEDLNNTDERDEQLLTGSPFYTPTWLDHSCNNEASKAVVMAPILISTIDYIINAAEPGRQAKHAIALLRVMHGDLIIDEIDSYDIKALAAVLRLVKLSAMFGRNVIISSATLQPSLANEIYAHYRSGFSIYKAMNGVENDFRTAIIDDAIPPEICTTHEFSSVYQAHVNSMIRYARLTKRVTKKRETVCFDKNITSMIGAIKNSVQVMHDRHQWGDTTTKLSIGLIRVAHVRRAIDLANEISKMPDTYVCCYHARHFAIQRSHIERRLDYLLKRKGLTPNQHILDDPEIQALLKQSEGRNIKIVVIATPVEEIGRDHDFDWAIIEPSSAQSIVQTAGRVNRHRLIAIFEANIAILQYNFLEVEPESYRPGLVFTYEQRAEDGSGLTSHSSHNLCELLDNTDDYLDADLQFNVLAKHKLSAHDEQAIGLTLKHYVEPIIENRSHWMGSDIYQKTPLREASRKVDWYYDEGDWYIKEYMNKGFGVKKMNGFMVLGNTEGLFTLSMDGLAVLAQSIGLTNQEAFKVTVHAGKDKPVNHLVNRFGCAATQ